MMLIRTHIRHERRIHPKVHLLRVCLAVTSIDCRVQCQDFKAKITKVRLSNYGITLLSSLIHLFLQDIHRLDCVCIPINQSAPSKSVLMIRKLIHYCFCIHPHPFGVLSPQTI